MKAPDPEEFLFVVLPGFRRVISTQGRQHRTESRMQLREEGAGVDGTLQELQHGLAPDHLPRRYPALGC